MRKNTGLTIGEKGGWDERKRRRAGDGSSNSKAE